MAFSIKKWLLDKKIKQLQGQQSTINTPAQNLGHSIGILYDDSADSQAIDQFIQRLNKQNRRLEKLQFIPTKEMLDTVDTITLKDINWYGWPVSDALDEFRKHQFDMLIVLTSKYSQIVSLIINTSNAHLKIGPAEYANDLNLMVDTPSNISTKQLVQAIVKTIDDIQPRTDKKAS